MKNGINRELATSIVMTEGGQPLKLTLIGSGNTCLVYRTEHNDIIKEFSPVIGGRATMSRKHSADGPLSVIESLSELDRSIVEDRLQSFTDEYRLVKELYSGFQERNDNMFLIPEQKRNTSLGLCHWCRYTGGNTLGAVFEEYRMQSKTFCDYMELVLPLVITLFDELAFYHSRDILNLDIKPDNLFSIKFNGKYIGIRNLDFGSARRAGDMLAQIRSYAAQNQHLPQSLLVLHISSKFFASSMPYYDENRIGAVILQCLDGQTGDDAIIRQLKLLDVLAAWKVLQYALCGEVPARTQQACEADTVHAQFMSLCRAQNLSESRFAFESYNVFFSLYTIMCRSFKGQLQYKLSAEEIRDSLSDVLCILQGIDENSRTRRQIVADIKNRALIRNEEVLKHYGLSCVADILSFWKQKTGTSHPPSAQDLLWYLRYGNVPAGYGGRVRSMQGTEQIDPVLFSGIWCNERLYEGLAGLSDGNGRIENAPLIRVWNDLGQNESLWLCGAACTGKSAAMRLLEAWLIHKEQPVFYYNCNEIGKDDMPTIGNELEGEVARIYLIDGLDELCSEFVPEMYQALERLQRMGCRLVISSRADMPYAEMGVHAFVRAELTPLTKQAICAALGQDAVQDEICVLLQNPMILKAYTLQMQGRMSHAELILEYFERLLQSKGAHLPAEWVAERLGAHLLGRAYGVQMTDLPGALRGIFEWIEACPKIRASMQVYEDFCMAMYLEKCMADHPELLMPDAVARLLSLNADRASAPLDASRIQKVCRYTAELLYREGGEVRAHVKAGLEKVVKEVVAQKEARDRAALILQTLRSMENE